MKVLLVVNENMDVGVYLKLELDISLVLLTRMITKYFCSLSRKGTHINIIPLISRAVPPGSTIHTDGANVYKTLGRHMRYNHNFVVHKTEYVTAEGIHTNWIENVWSNLKIKLKSLRGSQGTMLDGHIDEYQYRYNRKNEGGIFELMLQDIANFYPV